MKVEIINYLEKFEEETKEKFSILFQLIYESTSQNIEEKLWSKIPSFYVDGNFVRLIPFKDHINVEAKAVTLYRDQLSGYKLTPKGMLQIFHKDEIPTEILKAIIKDTFKGNVN